MKTNSFINQFLSIARLLRLPNCFALGFLFLTCQERYVNGGLTVHEYARAVTWVLLAGFAYAYNDLCDVEVDRINRPTRVLPSMSITTRVAHRVLLVIGLLILILIVGEWRVDAFWPITAFLGSVLYSRLLRLLSAFLSNVVASLLVAIVPLSATLTWDAFVHSWKLATGVALLIFARELQKDALDLRGDLSQRPPPVLMGPFGMIVEFAYPVILLVSAGLLYWATSSASRSSLSQIGPSLLVLILFGAAVTSIANRTAYGTQSLVTKVASYLLVLVMATRGI
jgi:4-hydroxybenzoate polyprenyltransferase